MKKLTSIALGALFLSISLYGQVGAANLDLSPKRLDVFFQNIKSTDDLGYVGFNGVTLGLYAEKARVGAVSFHIPKGLKKEERASTKDTRLYVGPYSLARVTKRPLKNYPVTPFDDKTTLRQIAAVEMSDILKTGSTIDLAQFVHRYRIPALLIEGKTNSTDRYMYLLTMHDENVYRLIYVYDPSRVEDLTQLRSIILSYDVSVMSLR